MNVRRPTDLTRSELAVLVREHLLAGQLMDRAGMPHVIAAHGRDVMGEIAIDEWMGASPIYTRRTQRLLGFEGSDVETIFKGMQFDIGAPPEFMDFRYRVIDADHGEFWLDHCGALMDVEPMGEEYVTTMCHAIEDPTFDATAWATNPRARVRPLHRPPRSPADRHPHCHWTVRIDPDAEALPEPMPVDLLRRTRVANLPVPVIDVTGIDAAEELGWSDYTRPLDPDLRIEQFSVPAMLGLVHEIGVQTHLLSISFLAAVEARSTHGDAVAIGAAQFAGIAGLTAERLRLAFGLGTTVADLAQVLVLHPALGPADYVALRVTPVAVDGSAALEIGLAPCPATEEAGYVSWIGLLAEGHGDGALDALVRGVDPHFACTPADPAPGELAAWRVVRSPKAASESRDVALTRFSSGADFRFSTTSVRLGPTRSP